MKTEAGAFRTRAWTVGDRVRHLMGWGLAVLPWACATPPPVSADTIFGDVRENEVGALDKYEGKTLRIEGIVQRTGLKNRSEVVASGSYASHGYVGRARKVSSQVPFAVLATDTLPSRGNVICYFEERRDVAKLRAGDYAAVEGIVYRVKQRGDLALVYMSGCSFPD